jgi:hypothetical protein
MLTKGIFTLLFVGAVHALVAPGLAQTHDFQRQFGLTLLAYRDTISVLAGETLTLTDPKWNWRDAPNSRLIVFAGDREVRPSHASSSVVRGTASGVQYVVQSRLQFDSAGTFTVLRIVEGRSPDNRFYRYGDVWLVRVRWPSLHPLLDDEYYYGEYAQFSFAAGHEDARRYSYEVQTAERTLFADSGAVVSIDRVWREYAAEALNATLTILGKYRNAVFQYEDPVTQRVRESVWRFTLKPPDRLSAVSLWQEDTTFDRLKTAARDDLLCTFPIDFNTQSKYNPREFRFTSYAVIRRNFLMFMPEVRNVDVSSEPSEFLSSLEWKADDPWRVLVIQPNEEMVRDRSVRNPLDVALRIRFTDQFGNTFDRKFKARVYGKQFLGN